MRPTLRRTGRADWLALALLTLATFVFFTPILIGGGWLPAGGGDVVSFLWPKYTLAARSLPGDLPLWNPHQFGGMPLWADSQSGVLYPPNLLLALLTDAPSYALMQVHVIGHIWWAGVAMYLCLRLLRTPPRILPGAALVGALAFMFSDFFITHQGHPNMNAVASWLPLILLGAWRALEAASGKRQAASENHADDQTVATYHAFFLQSIPPSGAMGWAALAGVAFAMSALAGHAQITYFALILLGGVGAWQIGTTVWRAYRARRGATHGSPVPVALGRQFVTVAIIGVIGAGLSAAALLPTLELAPYTGRAELTYEGAAEYSLPPRALVGLVAPWVYGRGPDGFTGDWDRVEVGYMGALALGLALIGAWRGIRRRDGLAIFLSVVALGALLLALGEYFPLHRLAYEIVPGFRQIRVPARLALLFNLAGAGLAAYGVQTITRTPRQASLRWIIAGLVAAEVILFGATVEVQYRDPTVGYAHVDAVAWLQAQPDAPFRIEGATPRWQPDTATRYGGSLYDITGTSNPLALAAYDTYYWGVGEHGSPTYNFLGAKYVIATRDAPPGDARFTPVYEADSGVTIYLNTGALPLAHLVYRAEPVETPEAAWDAIHDPAWDPGAVVYVEGGPPLDSAPPQGANLFFTVYEPNALAVVARTDAPAYLVLSEVWYPGWEATIDGQPAPIYRANYTFRAVYLAEPGEHTVLLRFRPASVAVGLGVSGVTLAALVMVALLLARWRRSPASA